MIISSVAEIAALIGDPARANMLFALKDDGRIAAGDLSAIAGIAPSTASEHLAKMVDAGLVEVTASGRKRYYDLAGPEVADILEGLEAVASSLSADKIRTNAEYATNIHMRSCYDHLAGTVGSRLAIAFLECGLIRQRCKDPELTAAGAECLASFNIDVEELRSEPRRFLRLCPDWTDRSVHIGGSVGAALLRGMINFDWLRRPRGSLNVAITPKGVAGFRSRFGLEI